MEISPPGHKTLDDKVSFSLNGMRQTKQKLTLFNNGGRIATIAYFNEALLMRRGDTLQVLAQNKNYIIPEGNGLTISVETGRIRFIVRKAGTSTYDTDAFNKQDEKNWARIQGKKSANIATSRSNTGLRVAVVLVLAAAAAATTVAFDVCPAQLDDQYAASGE